MSPTLSVVETYPVRDGAATSSPSVNDLAIRVGESEDGARKSSLRDRILEDPLHRASRDHRHPFLLWSLRFS